LKGKKEYFLVHVIKLNSGSISTNPLVLNMVLDGCVVVNFTLHLLYSREATPVLKELGVGWAEGQSGRSG
jgi:hypothetical protein